MRKLIVPAASLAVIASMSVAFAATASGQIKSMDASQHTITLNDNHVYQLPANFAVASLTVGERVNITYETSNGKMVASAVTKAQ